ncbi:hypothetical protein K1719_045106 [Acacia pycnantha]|nr:hypothetical protein K1719_045106 [Acacia pycnantha]
MALMRWMEIAADSLYKAKLIRGFCHLYDGQEAVAVGLEAAITKKDCIITAYRDHCTFLGRGGTLSRSLRSSWVVNLVARKERVGLCISIRRRMGFMVVTASLELEIPLGDGAANRDSCSRHLTWLRSGIYPLNIGLRIIIRAAKSPAYYKRGDYVPGLKVDGMDVLAVKQVVLAYVECGAFSGSI